MISQVSDVALVRHGEHTIGSLHITTHHLIFHAEASSEPPKIHQTSHLHHRPSVPKEVWVAYPIMAYVEHRPYSPFTGFSTIRIRCRDFNFLAFEFQSESESKEVFDTLQSLTCVSSVENLYAFYYHPSGSSEESKVNTWNIYDPVTEFQRMGVGSTASGWRFTDINKTYQFCPTYPSLLVVPTTISDTVLAYAGKYRSKARIPTLSYVHKLNNCTITRCAQPLVGLKQHRSPQDEQFISSIFASNRVPNTFGATQQNLIVDARPTTNAIAQTALGAGSENMENYKFARKVYLGIDNIHVMRDSLNKIYEALRDSDITPLPPNRELLYKSNWLKHISTIMEGAVLMGRRIHLYHSHVLVHCSDGWDRTAQLSSLAQIFLDPYFRTLDGFMILVEKEWLSFGHRFAERCGHLSSEKSFVQLSEKVNGGQMSTAEKAISSFMSAAKSAVEKAGNYSGGGYSSGPGTGTTTPSHGAGLKYTAPIFHQFLDCVYQLLRQFPTRFEYNERFLRRMLYHLNSCQYGNFLYNNEKERLDARVKERTHSIWDYFIVRRKEFINHKYNPDEAEEVIFPDPKSIRWWHEIFGRTEKEMSIVTLDGIGSSATAAATVQRRRQQVASDADMHARGLRGQKQQPSNSSKRLQRPLQEESYSGHVSFNSRSQSQSSSPSSSGLPSAYGASSWTSDRLPNGSAPTYADSLKETASATLASWASSIAEASNAWAAAATPYIVSSYADAYEEGEKRPTSKPLPQPTAVTDSGSKIIQSDAAEATLQDVWATPEQSKIRNFSEEKPVELQTEMEDGGENSETIKHEPLPVSFLSRSTDPKDSSLRPLQVSRMDAGIDSDTEFADEMKFSDRDEQDLMRQVDGMTIDPLIEYSLSHSGVDDHEYIPETE
ncbi:protein-tyrosine phosphatase-like protein [Lipomyces oligophaga]|uniref:protein-tyrosine phosphatase-like protein n=1 Tax=Lipomyces oligophaga TaxID=45792 RepID=UPI0034CF52DB